MFSDLNELADALGLMTFEDMSNWHSNFAVKENMLAVYKFPLELDDFLSL